MGWKGLKKGVKGAGLLPSLTSQVQIASKTSLARLGLSPRPTVTNTKAAPQPVPVSLYRQRWSGEQARADPDSPSQLVLEVSIVIISSKNLFLTLRRMWDTSRGQLQSTKLLL